MTIELGKNLDEVETEDKTFEPIPVGDYAAVVQEAVEQTSKNGNQMIVLTFKLEGNPQYDGRLFWRYIVFGLSIHSKR